MNYRINNQSFLFALALSLLGVLGGCATPSTVADLTPGMLPHSAGTQPLQGSIEVQTIVPTKTTDSSHDVARIGAWIDAAKFKQAIEGSVTRFGLAGSVEQSDADYVLEVWIDKIQNTADAKPEGFRFDITSLWRLTRTRDNQVLACVFVTGHGEAGGDSSRAFLPAISAATRTVIQKGLVAVADRSQPHLSALATEGNRPTISVSD